MKDTDEKRQAARAALFSAAKAGAERARAGVEGGGDPRLYGQLLVDSARAFRLAAKPIGGYPRRMGSEALDYARYLAAFAEARTGAPVKVGGHDIADERTAAAIATGARDATAAEPQIKSKKELTAELTRLLG